VWPGIGCRQTVGMSTGCPRSASDRPEFQRTQFIVA
jgi:hypothetical protein